MKSFALSLFLLATFAARLSVAAAEDRILQDLTMEQRLGQSLPVDEKVTDETGATRPLKEFLTDRPTIFVFVYHECPMLCGEVLAGLQRTLGSMPLAMGKDYNLLAISLSPTDTVESAAKKKTGLGIVFQHAKFLVADAPTIKKFTDTLGYTFATDPETKQIAHPSGFFVLTPEGKVSKVFYGLEYNGKALRLALVEASRGKIGTVVDRLLLLCFHYDPKQGRYGLAIDRVLKAAGVSTVAALSIWVMRNRNHEG